ncbi:MAG: hypothetical protein PHC64_10690 [Candidatus Gastranaerophilales bacterium]|nr:hypothetical protein [Candidatus Gastranaerophilales bacterium]
MGITLDVDMYLLCSMFNISAKKITDEYAGMTIEEIMETEAEQGNTAAAKFDKDVLNDPIKLIELFELKNVGNKFAILNNMNEKDLEELIPLLSEEDLIEGLNYFSKDKLLSLMQNLPIEQLLKLTFEMFSPEHLMYLMPENQVDKILTSTDMDKGLELKYLQTLKPEILAQMYQAATGQPAPGMEEVGLDGKPNLDGTQLLAMIAELPADKFQDAMLGIPTQNKKEFVVKLAQENPKLYQAIDPKAYTDIIGQRKEKQDIIRYANVIEKEQLVEMIEELPKDLTAAVLTQIDPKLFAQVLIANFKNILSQIVAG